jgi:RHS repeat-associated protein
VRASSSYGWAHGHQGLRYETATGNYANRHREYRPTLMRFVQNDPAGMVDGTNLYAAYGNLPNGAVDPDGLQSFSVPAHQDYKNYPTTVEYALAIVYDIILSGHPDENVRKGSGSSAATRGFGSVSFYEAMEATCTKLFGEGSTPIPLHFSLQALKFYPTTASGGRAGPPRREKVRVPVLYTESGKSTFVIEETKSPVALAHFIIEGYWAFRCKCKGRDSHLIGLPVKGVSHTGMHAPYDKEFLAELEAIKKKYSDKTSVVIGRSYDRLAPGMSAKALGQTGDLSKYLLLRNDGSWGRSVQRVDLGDVLENVVFPK